ncbi:DDRGK domain-containing protein 1 [Fasciolopsis buskii]|uniref:DDRGK domain-containing protein 1 n=1 Tax=Fasciolopsis buskii TaxID=27845 RepID=A0A8E0VM46_9TREM|nr:DDRGK domain-containing protein 1 [Fasciolopsis buski]
MLFVNFPVYFAVLAVALGIAGYLFWIFYQKKLKTGGTRIRRRPVAQTAGSRRNQPVHRRLAARMRVDVDDDAEADEDNRVVRRTITPNQAQPEESVDSADEGRTASEPAKKKIGAKKAAKLAEKERRKEEREAEERYREHQRKLEDQEIERRKKAEQAEEQAAALAAAEEAKRRAEEEAREQAEYERLKKEFSIEDEGTDVVQRDSKAEAEFNAQLISVIQTAKIISVEHLALEFGLKTEACVDKLKSLLASGQLTGLLDDRGKFVHITDEEYEAVAEFITRRGRVTLAELVANGNRLLNLVSAS